VLVDPFLVPETPVAGPVVLLPVTPVASGTEDSIVTEIAVVPEVSVMALVEGCVVLLVVRFVCPP
jgi:hypothetical protein